MERIKSEDSQRASGAVTLSRRSRTRKLRDVHVRWNLFDRRPTVARSALLAVVCPALATLVAAHVPYGRPNVQLIYILAVVLASAFGGGLSGMAASIVSFLGLNYYFTVPYHAFRVNHFGDVAALFVFAVVSGIVAAMFARILYEQARAGTARTNAEINQARAALFSSVTHDLRTPLASIKAGVTGLLDGDVAYDSHQHDDLLRTVVEETDRLSRLVDNLLNLARAHGGNLAMERELTPFEDVIEIVVSRMRRILEPFKITASIDNDLPPVWLDQVQMDHALTNILENAARHSPAGAEIGIAVSAADGGIRIAISDHGPGIPPEDREAVFEPFVSRDVGGAGRGSGLGLAIARAVVHAHHGSIGIEGNGGTTVVIELPVGSPESVS
jgi:K+-sensing histidine kinase KdpD